MGPQGSGKGTQARLLAEKYDLQVFEMGLILRDIALSKTEIGKKIDELINKKGQFVPWNIVKEAIEHAISKFDKNRGIVFDGTPRRLEEVEYWEKKFKDTGRTINHVFYIDVSQEESVRRLSSRKLCKKYGHPLIVGVDVGEKDAKCPICGSEIYKREDDTPEKILKRLKWSEELLSPVVEYYKNKNMLIKIDGGQSIEEVFKEIVDYIK